MKKRINLALQGGGAHGAFTWGVLDRLLEEPDIEISAISGTSAGALNAAALKSGLINGGRDGARAALEDFWTQITSANPYDVSSWMSGWMSDVSFISAAIEHSVPYSLADSVSRMASPYSWGATNSNPLAPLIEGFDFDCVQCDEGPALHICATNVRTGKVRVFSGSQISSDALLASACLPTMFKAVEIDDSETGQREAYWDGGYTGNPALFPLFDPSLPEDVLIVNINPLVRHDIPKTPSEIQNRINEISFNSSLLRELRAIDFVQRLVADDAVKAGAMKDMRIHMIADDELMTRLSVATKMVPVQSVITQLKAAGRDAASRFFDVHFDDLNAKQTCDLRAMFG